MSVYSVLHPDQSLLYIYSRRFPTMKSFVAALGFIASATTVVGHSTFQELWTNGYVQVCVVLKYVPHADI